MTTNCKSGNTENEELGRFLRGGEESSRGEGPKKKSSDQSGAQEGLEHAARCGIKNERKIRAPSGENHQKKEGLSGITRKSHFP